MRNSDRGKLVFRVRESEVINPDRVAQGLRVWADYLARASARVEGQCPETAAPAETKKESAGTAWRTG